jgi:hypothetical protein
VKSGPGSDHTLVGAEQLAVEFTRGRRDPMKLNGSSVRHFRLERQVKLEHEVEPTSATRVSREFERVGNDPV